MTTTPRPAYIWDANSNDWAPLAGTVDTGQSYNFSAVQNFNAGVSSTSYNGGSIIGRNKIINGDFGIWQRGTTINGAGWANYCADRWLSSQYNGFGTVVSRQAFTSGSAPAAGYESQYFLRQVVPSSSDQNTYAGLSQSIEGVRTLAGQTVTLSFWAKAASGTPNIILEYSQFFGAGGSSNVNAWNLQTFTLNTQWTRYTKTFTLPSISGKTIGTSSDDYLNVLLWTSGGTTYGGRMPGLQANTFDFWGFQLEAGNQATPYHNATPNQQTELAACQRYYYRINDAAASSWPVFGFGWANTTGNLIIHSTFPVKMRTKPSSIDISGMATYSWEFSNQGGNTATSITLDNNYSSQESGVVNVVKASAFTVNQQYRLNGNANNAAYLGFSAEL
jgi:hypothetical protein